jgi:hypothetical protein
MSAILGERSCESGSKDMAPMAASPTVREAGKGLLQLPRLMDAAPATGT